MRHQNEFFITVMMKDISDLPTHLLLPKSCLCYPKGYRQELYSNDPNVLVVWTLVI